MRRDEQLIHSALGSHELPPESIRRMDKPAEHFNLYSVVLPDKFKGLPSEWYFGILCDGPIAAGNLKSVTWEAGKLIHDLIHAKEVPIVFISTDPKIDLKGYFQFEKPVFFLMENQLPGSDNFPHLAKDAPIIQAARNKYKNGKASHELSPYWPNKPVDDWRFFGRKNEIKKLVESKSNFFVIGARRIGKTSLLYEVRRQLKKQGEIIHWVRCQYALNVGDVVKEMIELLPARDKQGLYAKNSLDPNFIVTVIRKLKGDNKQVTFFFDEIGRAIEDLSNDSWRFIGVLRELSHGNEIRCILSAFQQSIIKQLKNFEGPFVNFGTTLYVNTFKKAEIEELVLYPLHFWGRIRNSNELGNRIKKTYGSHPLILQFLGEKLFNTMVVSEEKYVDDIFRDLETRENIALFKDAVEQIFFKIDYLERFVFLRLCMDIEEQKKDFGRVEVRQDTIKSLLLEIGMKSELDTRDFLLQRLHLRGLLSQDPSDYSVYRVDSPIIYTYIKTFHKPDDLLLNFIGEIDMAELDISKLKW